MKAVGRAIKGTIATRNRGVYISGYSDHRNQGYMGRGHLGISSHTFSDSSKALKNFKDSIRSAHNS